MKSGKDPRPVPRFSFSNMFSECEEGFVSLSIWFPVSAYLAVLSMKTLGIQLYEEIW